jgi:enolase
MEIRKIDAREILDSRGNPTIQVDITLDDGTFSQAAVPSGASTGRFEALELRDGDASRYHGKGVLKAIANIRELIEPEIRKIDPSDQEKLDSTLIELDGTENKRKLGANAMLGVSLAVARAVAKSRQIPLFQYLSEMFENKNVSAPVPHVNILNGGAHADNPLDFQEFMIVPLGAPNFPESIRMCSEIFHTLKNELMAAGHVTAVGDEGGFAPQLESNTRALEFVLEAVIKSGYKPGVDVGLALDAASTEFYDESSKLYQMEGKPLSSDELIEIYQSWLEPFHIVSIEDGLAEDDWEGWKKMTSTIGSQIQLVGDDLFVTNTKRFSRGIEEKAGNSILIKLNQIGTLTETLKTMKMAKDSGFTSVVSHRSGETEDTFVADLAIGTNSGQIKTGSVSRGERTAKYNRILSLTDSHRLSFANWREIE